MSRSRLVGNRSSLSRYDATLLAVPILFLGTILAAAIFETNYLLALGTAALASGLLIADSLFFNPPAGTDLF